MDKIQLKALAKINLGLDVLRRREDGYHEVKMIMQTIGLHDDLEIRKTKTPGIQVKTNLYYLPTNENNLVYKAAKLLMDEFQVQEGLLIRLRKFIPVAAGMAGGRLADFLMSGSAARSHAGCQRAGDEGSAAGAGHVHQNGDAAGGGASGGTAP